MSCEGFDAHICKKGHYYEHGFFDPAVGFDHPNCPVCGEAAEFFCSVDETNGVILDETGTFVPDKLETGFTDKWQVDHYGNKYAVKVITYKPVVFGIPREGNPKIQIISNVWRKVGGYILPITEWDGETKTQWHRNHTIEF